MMTAIRRGRPADLEAVAAIQYRSPEAAQWDPRDYLTHDFWVAAASEDRVAGFLVLRRTAAHAAIGISVGIVSAALLTRYLQTLLFGITPLDPATFVGAALVFALVAFVAAYIPARHATTIDPLVSLRSE